jgi:hypothetical protein
MSKDKSKYCRYLKSAEDSLKKALLVDNYTNRSFTITTKISKSAKYPVRSPIKIINGANYESDASELNTENVEPMDISPPESSNMELSPKEADIVWLDVLQCRRTIATFHFYLFCKFFRCKLLPIKNIKRFTL